MHCTESALEMICSCSTVALERWVLKGVLKVLFFYFLFVILYLSLYFWLDEMKPTCTPAERVTSFSSHSWMLVIFFYQKKLKGVSQSVTTVTSNLWQVYTWPLLSLKNKCPDFDMTESQSLPLRDIFLYRTSFAMKGVHVHAFGLTVS